MFRMLLALWAPLLPLAAGAQEAPKPLVRIAEIEVDPAQLDAYNAILAEEIEAAVRIEPGVLMLYALADAARPSHVRTVEVYADRAAYEAHIRTPHFLKYKTSTAKMVLSLKLIDTVPIRLCAKPAVAMGC